MSGPSDDQLEALAPGVFAGSWLVSGRLHVAYTRDPELHAARARAELGLSSRTTVVRHTLSLRDLGLIAAGVEQTTDELAAAGATLHALAPVVSENVIEVVLEPATHAARDLLTTRFGAAVRVVEARVELT